MKPDWKDAPEWAKYLAMDSDGEWNWHEFQPRQSRHGTHWRNHGLKEFVASWPAWNESLEPRP